MHYTSQKKRLLAKAQSECMLNVPTKQEPGMEYHRSNDCLVPQQSHCNAACKEPPQNYQYVNSGGVNHLSGQEQHVVYSANDKRISWAPPAAHAPSSHGNHRRHSAVPVVNLREYAMPPQPHKEYIQPPAAHTTRDGLAVGREQHLLAPGKSWGPPQPMHQSYRWDADLWTLFIKHVRSVCGVSYRIRVINIVMIRMRDYNNILVNLLKFVFNIKMNKKYPLIS